MTVQGALGFGGLSLRSPPLRRLKKSDAQRRGCKRLTLSDESELLPILKYLWQDKCAADVGENLDILHELPANWPVRDQGHIRGTCVAFAALSAVEAYRFWSGAAEDAEDFSEELLYALMRDKFDLNDHFPDLERDGEIIPGYEDLGASLLWQAGSALDAYGVSGEANLPYVYDQRGPAFFDETYADAVASSQMIPVAGDREHTVVEMPTAQDRPADKISDSLRYLLSHKTPVCVSFPVLGRQQEFNEWTFPSGWTTGQIPDPSGPSAKLQDGRFDSGGGHSVCIVGYCADPNTEGDGWFLFRNSWGRRFGHASDFTTGFSYPLERGYGLISTAHVNTYCWEMMFLIPKEEI